MDGYGRRHPGQRAGMAAESSLCKRPVSRVTQNCLNDGNGVESYPLLICQ
ncbi:hypothetical protein BHMPCIPO_05080 [Ensifer sesbaniae]|nr:hypothetical protein [Ensifer sesbaniae]